MDRSADHRVRAGGGDRAQNASRHLLQQLATLRAADPPHLSGVDALQFIATSFFMPRATTTSCCAASWTTSDPPAARKARLFVGGSPLDNLEFYALVEACGATIVAEDHCWGNRCGEAPPTPACRRSKHSPTATTASPPAHRLSIGASGGALHRTRLRCQRGRRAVLRHGE